MPFVWLYMYFGEKSVKCFITFISDFWWLLFDWNTYSLNVTSLSFSSHQSVSHAQYTLLESIYELQMHRFRSSVNKTLTDTMALQGICIMGQYVMAIILMTVTVCFFYQNIMPNSDHVRGFQMNIYIYIYIYIFIYIYYKRSKDNIKAMAWMIILNCGIIFSAMCLSYLKRV